MPLIKRTKSGKVRCPICDKIVEPYYDKALDLMILDCCHKYSLFEKYKKHGRRKKC